MLLWFMGKSIYVIIKVVIVIKTIVTELEHGIRTLLACVSWKFVTTASIDRHHGSKLA